MVTIAYADGPSAPRIAPATAARLAGLDDGPPHDVLLGWTLERHAWLAEPDVTGRTVLAGYGLSAAVIDGRITPLPVRLSAVPKLLRDDPPTVGVVAGVRSGAGYSFSGSVGWGDVLAATAGRVVVEVDEAGVDLGGPAIEGNIVAEVVRPAATGRLVGPRPADEIDLRIGAMVASLVPDDATLEFGPGGVGEGIARALDRPVGIWSGLCTEAMAALHGRGLLREPVVAAYTMGGAAIRELAAADMLRLTPTTITHDLSRLSAIPRFIGCNTALQVGLDGSANVERVAGRVIAAIGGHSDFCAGASRSTGGISIIAVRSTNRRGDSTIVPRVDVVSTQRSDIDVVVTEHGIADLRGVTERERTARMIDVAAPEHRSDLRSSR